jgi:hypothetical protein
MVTDIQATQAPSKDSKPRRETDRLLSGANEILVNMISPKDYQRAGATQFP